MRKLRWFLILCFVLSSASARAATVYVAQSAGLQGSGTLCNGQTAIAPGSITWTAGNTYVICGNWTLSAGASGTINVTGSGSTGNLITIRFDNGVVVSAPYWGTNGFINISGSFILVEGSYNSTPCGSINGVNTACNGTIQATANGAAFANQVPGGKCVSLSGGSNVTVQDLECTNLFVGVTCQANLAQCANNEVTGSFGGNSACVFELGTGYSNITIQNNVCLNSWAAFKVGYQGAVTGVTIQNNWVTNINVAEEVGAGNSNSSLNGLVIANNDESNMAPFDTSLSCGGGCPNHHEFMHIFTQQNNSSIGTSGSPALVYGNYLHGTIGYSATAEIYIECDSFGLCGAPSALFINAFNNIVVNTDPNADISTGVGGNGMTSTEGATVNWYNNTFFSNQSTGAQNTAIQCEVGSVIIFKNNIFDGMNNAWAVSGSCPAQTVGTNLGFGLGTACGANCSLSSDPKLNASSIPPYQFTDNTSGGYRTGTNLTSLGITQLVFDAIGDVRPTTGAWDVGAFYLVNNFFISQAGGGAGTSCVSPLAISFFNTAGNWGTGGSQIGPGTIVHLCGTITGALTFQGNGASGNPVILDGTGATMNQSIIVPNGKSWETIQNVTWQANYNLTPFVIELESASNIVVQGNFLDSFLANGTTGGGDIVWMGNQGTLTNNVDIKNNTFGYSTASTNVQSDIISTEGSTNVTIEGNLLTQRNPDNAQHNDVIQAFCKNANANCPNGTPSNWTIRYNRIVMNTTSTNNKSWCMIENMGGTLQVYGNVFLGLAGDTMGNGCSLSSVNGSPAAQTTQFYDNTVVALNGSMTNLIDCNFSVACNVENNIVYTTTGSSNALKRAVTVRTNNLWFGPASPSCSGFPNDICGSDPLFVNTAAQNFALQATSPAIGKGANLGSPFNQAIAAGSVWPGPTLTPFPSLGNWDIGAYCFNCSGSGGTPGISFTPTSLTFPGQTQNTTSAPQNITAKNTGTATLLITSITITGTNAADFAQTNNCGSGIAPGGSCTIVVTFTPSALGARSATINVADNVVGSPQTVAVSGTGVAAPSGISFTPTSLAFGNQQVAVASSPLSTTVTNTGAGTLIITAVTITGTNASDFTQTNNCASVAPSATCVINVTFKPGATGARSGSVSVTDNAAGSPQSVPLTGTGTVPGVGLSPASLAFGNQNTGTSSAGKPVTLTNTGAAPLTITSITITGTNPTSFSQTNNCGTTVVVGGSCTITATFSPTAAGALSANISVADNAAGSPHTVPMTGTGVSLAPVVTFSQPGGLGFGSVAVNNSVLVVQHMQNTGSAVLTISSITVGGTNASMFTTHNTCGASLVVGHSCEISIIFKPTSIGAKTATISVTDNAAGSPQSFAVNGTGITATLPTLDQYGGKVASPCASTTGRFHVEQVGNQWTYCTPLGNQFFLLGIYGVDFNATAGYLTKVNAKYGNTVNWAVPTLQRIQSWGFNSPYYNSNVGVQPFATNAIYPTDANGLHSIPIKMPITLFLKPGLYGMRNPVFKTTAQFPTGQMLPIGGTIKNMAAGWSPIYTGFVPPTGEADYYDPNLATFSNNFLSSQETNATTSPYSDYVIGVAYDDGDQVFGMGAGPDFVTTPVGHNNPNLGWLVATMSPTQAVSNLYPAVYTNTQVYSKVAWMNYLLGKYGSISALNTAWGSNYTSFGTSGTAFSGESIGTGNGTTTTFTHTMAHLTPTPFTVQILVNGLVVGGDLGHGTTGTLYGASAAVTPVQTLSGTLVYSTGALSVTFNTAPVAGAVITVNYQQNGWQTGTGLMDEDGRVSHQTWLSGNPVTLAGANANTVVDLNTFFFQMVNQYFSVGHNALASWLPGYLFLGPDTIGSWQAPPARQVLQAVPGNLDVITGSIQQPGGANYQAQLDFIFTYAGNMPQEQGEYLHSNPDSPYSANPLPGDYTTQFLRGQAYGNIVVNGKAAAYTSNSAKPVIASSAFDFLDLSSEQTNWGIVTQLDNAYDGNEATTSTVTCSPPLQAFSCGGEAATYGNYASCVTQANVNNTICSSSVGTPNVSVSPSSLTYLSQAVGSPSNTQAIVITNTGTAAVTFSSISLTGANPGDYGQTNNCGTTLAVSQSCSVLVTFMPTAAGSRTATVSIADNVAGSPQTVTLTGTGVIGPIVAPDPGMFGD